MLKRLRKFHDAHVKWEYLPFEDAFAPRWFLRLRHYWRLVKISLMGMIMFLVILITMPWVEWKRRRWIRRTQAEIDAKFGRNL